MKKVIMIAQSSYVFDPRITRFTRVLTEQNFEVEVICLRYDNMSKFEIIDGVKVHKIMKPFPQNTIISYVFYSLIFTIKALIKCTALSLGEKKPAFIHVHNMPDYLVFTTLYAKLRRVPIILDMHDLTVELFKEKWSEMKFNKVKFLLKFVEKISCNYADHIITVTKECVDILVGRGINPKKISLIMNSAEEDMFHYDEFNTASTGDYKHKVLYHGTIARRFGLHYFIKAFPEIVKKIPDMEFHIYGGLNEEYSDELQNLIGDLNLRSNVFFKQMIPYNQVGQMIKSYDLGVVTYELTEYMNLAIPTKACEYAASGLPFIISELTSVQTIFRKESVMYVKPEDYSDISDLVLSFYSDPSIGKVLSTNAYEDVSKITWQKMKLRYLELIQNKLNTPVNL